mmetsp:Transcript_22683/g.77464  ORF Transcript_22683/g.77464 Transcript_22683/m.77464 type:complete len:111 (+) Transcript_22683:188-520(+)
MLTCRSASCVAEGKVAPRARWHLAAVEHVAVKAAVVATSTSHAMSHVAWAAAAGNEVSYWASTFDEEGHVSFAEDSHVVRSLDVSLSLESHSAFPCRWTVLRGLSCLRLL